MNASNRAREAPSTIQPDASVAKTLVFPKHMLDELERIAAESGTTMGGRRTNFADVVRLACRELIERRAPKRKAAGKR